MRIVASGNAWLRRIVDIALIALIVIVLGGVALGKLVPLTGRATVVIGGGSMAPVIPLGSASGALRLTTARYFTPSGRSIQAKGVSPDIEVLQEVPEELKARTDTRGEA